MVGKWRHGTKLDGVAATAAETSRTVEITDGMEDATSAGIGVSLAWSSGTAIVVTVWKSADVGSTWYKVPALSSLGDGSFDALDYSVTKSVVGDDSLWIDVDARNCNALKYVVEVSGGGAGDLITSQVCTCQEG